VRVQWRIAVLGLDYRSAPLDFFTINILMCCADAPDFFESSFWKDSDAASGLGGWGDSNADFSVPDGGLNKFHISYPSPHTLRRNFTLRPYETAFIPWLNASDIEANSTFTAAKVEELLGTSAGDYKSFQAVLEAFYVRTWDTNFLVDMFPHSDDTLGRTQLSALDHGRVSSFVAL
jgi:hypothetical protein